MTRLFRKYLASGMVFQMSRNGWIVSVVGIHCHTPWTSPRGFSDVESITYSGSNVKSVRKPRTTRRTQGTQRGSDTCRPPPAGGQREVRAADQHEEQQQQHRHGGAEAEVPGHERTLVDVDGD